MTIRAFFQRDLVEAEVFLAWPEQRRRGEICANFQVLDERSNDDGVFLRLRGQARAIDTLKAQLKA